MDLKLNDDQLQSAVAGAIIGTLTPEVKQELLTTAVKSLLEPRKDPYNYGKKLNTPLQDAFENQVSLIAQSVVREFLNKDTDLRAKIAEMYKLAVDKVLAGDSIAKQNLVDRMADNFVSFLSFEPK